MCKKVLIVTPFYHPNIGGAETFAECLNTELSKHYDVSVCSINWGKQKVWKGTNLTKVFEVIPRLLGKALRCAVINKIDIIYALGLNAAFVAWVIRRLTGIRYTVTMLALYDFINAGWLFKKVSGIVLRAADRVYVEGNGGIQDIRPLRIPSHKIRKFYHWVDQDRFHYVDRNNDKLHVLFVGRSIREKGMHLVKRIEKVLHEVKFTYCTDTPYSELDKYYKQADILVVPSLYSEGFCRVIAEAASCGCIIIASDRGSLPEMVAPFGKVIYPSMLKLLNTVVDFLIKKRIDIKAAQLNTAIYALNNFNNSNASVFL